MPVIRGEGGEQGTVEREGRDDQETALIPKSLLMGKEVEPGDKVVLEVKHIYEDEVEVCYAKEKKKEKAPMEEADEELEGMAEPEDMMMGMGPPPMAG